jgi:ABC-2 type transport system permease protein
MFILVVINNVLFKTTYNEDGVYQEKEEESIEEEISTLENKLKTQENLEYVDTKTSLELLEIKKNYSKDSFQYNMINTYFYDAIYNINYYKYIVIDEEQVKFYESIYQEYLNRFNNNDNLSFIKDNLDNIQLQLEEDNDNKLLQLNKEVLELRIKYNIDYGNTYLNRAIDNYYESSLELENYNNDKLSYQEKLTYNKLITDKNISKYIIENKVNLNKDNDLRGCLKTILEDYELVIVIIIAFITSSIVSEEYSKGTIKQLLIKPYTRSSILLSKYLACLIVLIISIIFLVLSELWIGGVIFGFSSLKIPVVIYDLNIGSLKEYDIFIYMLIRILLNIPKLVILLTICFGISTIFLNSVLSAITTICLYIFSDAIVNFFSKYSFTKYLVITNWNFSDYLNGNINRYFDITINCSIIICFLCFLLLNLLIFVIFKKRDIKNI